jgi:hypothetical protein
MQGKLLVLVAGSEAVSDMKYGGRNLEVADIAAAIVEEEVDSLRLVGVVVTAVVEADNIEHGLLELEENWSVEEHIAAGL